MAGIPHNHSFVSNMIWWTLKHYNLSNGEILEWGTWYNYTQVWVENYQVLLLQEWWSNLFILLVFYTTVKNTSAVPCIQHNSGRKPRRDQGKPTTINRLLKSLATYSWRESQHELTATLFLRVSWVIVLWWDANHLLHKGPRDRF